MHLHSCQPTIFSRVSFCVPSAVLCLPLPCSARMLKVQLSSPSPDGPLQTTPSLADLSRNASVISSSSSSSSTSDLTLQSPERPRPLRTFSSPRSRSPQSPSTPRGSRPPAYLARELGLAEHNDDRPAELRPPASRAPSKSRSSSVNGRNAADDYEFGRVLGEGSYSTVRLAKHRVTHQEYAIKILDKGHLRRYGKMPIALAEKNTLVRLGAGHPGIVRLHQAFQDEWSLYFVLDLARNGELKDRISCMGSLSTACARVYAAQIVDALDYMHSRGVIHRDLKPENLLLDDDLRIKITDFGTGKILDPGGERTKTFVGTAQYVAPELLEDSQTSESSDFWALGCILYQMISGRFAFRGLSDYLTYQKIKQLDYAFPDGFDAQAGDLVRKLLVRDPAARLGAGPAGSPYDMKALRAHPFFASISWGTLWTDPVPPLEPGLVKRPHANGGSSEDANRSWAELVAEGEDPADDEISWASDGEGAVYDELSKAAGAKAPNGNTNGKTNGNTNGNGYFPGGEVGPMGERRPYFAPVPVPVPQREDGVRETMPPPSASAGSVVRFAAVPEEGSAEADVDADSFELRSSAKAIPAAAKAQPIDVPRVPLVESYSTGSATSSSDGSPVDRLDGLAVNRGRNRAQIPIQGNGVIADSEWCVRCCSRCAI
ncbi:kinase-like domain-containing protein [Sparassis latifolia]